MTRSHTRPAARAVARTPVRPLLLPLGLGGLLALAALPVKAQEAEVMAAVPAGAIEDARVYALAETYDATFWDSGEPFGAVTGDWGEVGEVEDVLIDISGSVLGVTVEVGGFLGIGEKTVLIPLADMRLVQQPDDSDLYIVTRLSNEQLEELPEIETIYGD